MQALTLPVALPSQASTPVAESDGEGMSLPLLADGASPPAVFANQLAQQLELLLDRPASGRAAKTGKADPAEADAPGEDAAALIFNMAKTSEMVDQGRFVVPPIVAQQAEGGGQADVETDVRASASLKPLLDGRAVQKLAAKSDAQPALADFSSADAATEKVSMPRQFVAASAAAFAGMEPAAAVPSHVPGPTIAPPVSAPAHSEPVASAAIAQPLSSPVWGDVLGDRVKWMVGQQFQGAELHLNPPALGPLEIKLSMHDGQANLLFSTQHAPVKEAIEAAAPRLREMLGESGINLGSVSVNVGSFSQQQPGDQAQGGQHWRQSPAATDFSSLIPSAVTVVGGRGAVDIFA